MSEPQSTADHQSNHSGHIDPSKGNPGVPHPESFLTHRGTLAEAMRALREKGYTANFTLKHDRVACSETSCELGPDEFEVEHAFRFDVMSDPGDQSARCFWHRSQRLCRPLLAKRHPRAN